jgi:hypothetical protein
MTEKNAEWKWIPTSERLPEKHKEVFIMEILQEDNADSILVWVGSLCLDLFMIFNNGADQEPSYINVKDVDFWAEIPPPPENRKDKNEMA